MAIKSIPPFIHLSIEYFDKLPGRYSQNLYAIPWLGYNKLNGLETSTSAALVREAESDMATMINQMDAVYQPLLPG
ncbi:MAG: hypothetical protein P8X74_17825 [Reinekea sp.]